MIRNFTLTVIFYLLFLQSFNGFAQSTIDSNFKPAIVGNFGNINLFAPQPDGKILIGGNFQFINQSPYSNIARLNADGTVDPSFKIGIGPDKVVVAIQIQRDGKILVAGHFINFNNYATTGLVRLNSNGAIDESFTISTSINLNATTNIIVQPDDKILLGGVFYLQDQERQTSVIRLNPDGSLDNSFTSGCSGSYQNGMVLQPDGKIILGGTGHYVTPLIRLNPDGTPDNTFTPDREVIKKAEHIALQDDKIIVTGKSDWTGTPMTLGFDKVIRLNNDGSLDNDFFIGTLNSEIYSIAALKILPNQKILLGGYFDDYNNNPTSGLVQLNQDGSFDLNFKNAVRWVSSLSSISNQNDGKILIAGIISITTDRGLSTSNLFRLLPDGSVESSFGSTLKIDFNGHVYKTAIAPDNKVVVCGDFYNINGKPKQSIARFLPDGTLDETFKTDFFISYSFHLLHIQPDGKILTGGRIFYNYQDPYPLLIRLNADGSVDPGFHLDIPSLSWIGGMNIQPDGKILIIATTTGSNPTLFRLNTDGSRDETFQSGSGAIDKNIYSIGNASINSVGLQTDGKIIVGGEFEVYNGTSKKNIVRLLPNGTFDESFMEPAIWNPIFTVTVQPDNKILLGSIYESFTDSPQQRSIIRLKPDGAIDASFTGQATGVIYAIEVEPSGKLLVGGSFKQVNGTTRNNIVRLNSNGSTDNSFDLGSGTNDRVSAIALSPKDGTIYIGGEFYHFNKKAQSGLARILPPAPIAPTTLAASLTPLNQVNLTWTDNADNELGYEIQRSTATGAGFIAIDTSAGNTTTFTDQGVLPGFTYYYRVRAFNFGGYSDYTSEVKVDINKSGHIVTGTKEPISLDFSLKQNYPNPFNNLTTIQYNLKKPAAVMLDVIDAQGRIVQQLVQQTQKTGTYQVLLDGKSLKSRSIYFIRLQANNHKSVIRAIYQ